MSIFTAMIEEILDQREGQPEPNSAGKTGGGAVPTMILQPPHSDSPPASEIQRELTRELRGRPEVARQFAR